MNYHRRTVRCAATGLSQEDALNALYDHPQFKSGTRVVGISESNGQWVATIMEPKAAKQAGPPPFPPKDEETEDAPPTEDGPPKPEGDSEDSAPSPDDGPSEEGPPKPKGDKGDKPKGEKGELAEVLNLIHMIADKLGISDSPIPGVEDGPPAPPLGPPEEGLGPEGPPPGPPGAGGKPPPPKRPIRPGETPPNVTPINSPAFASTNGNQVVGKVGSFTAREVTNLPIHEAKRELESLYGPQGYHVRQIKAVKTRDGERELRALLSVK